MFEILESRQLVPNIHMLSVRAPEVAQQVQPGNFIILRAYEDGERIPLTVSDWDKQRGTITLVFMSVGVTTSRLATMRTGDMLPTVVGPLGNPFELGAYGTVACVGGCYGIASIYPAARALKEMGNKVCTVIEARSSFLFYWEEKLKRVSDRLIYITRDGTKGFKGHINQLPEIFRTLEISPDWLLINGCNYVMMRASEATQPMGWKTTVSLNTLMIDGTGMCGVCRVTVGGKTKFTCVDGPHFDGHQVDWEELAQRRKAYLREEVIPMQSSRAEI